MSLTIGSGPLAPDAAGSFNARLDLPERLLLCFFNERIDLEVDGEPMDRTRTQWSRDDD